MRPCRNSTAILNAGLGRGWTSSTRGHMPAAWGCLLMASKTRGVVDQDSQPRRGPVCGMAHWQKSVPVCRRWAAVGPATISVLPWMPAQGQGVLINSKASRRVDPCEPLKHSWDPRQASQQKSAWSGRWTTAPGCRAGEKWDKQHRVCHPGMNPSPTGMLINKHS